MRHKFEKFTDILLHIKEANNLTSSNGLQKKADASNLLKKICNFKFIFHRCLI